MQVGIVVQLGMRPWSTQTCNRQCSVRVWCAQHEALGAMATSKHAVQREMRQCMLKHAMRCDSAWCARHKAAPSAALGSREPDRAAVPHVSQCQPAQWGPCARQRALGAAPLCCAGAALGAARGAVRGVLQGSTLSRVCSSISPSHASAAS